MKTFIYIVACLLLFNFANAQVLKSIPDGGNKKASVSEQVGITDVKINYNRPGVKGREGKIYGTPIVHAGYSDLGFGTSKAAPWRAGANENTTIEFSTPVRIEGKDLPAGIYAFFVAYDPTECTLIFSKNSTSWGSFFYNDKEDALRVKVKPVSLDKSVERLKYEFIDQTDNSATIALEWEKLRIPFKVEVDLINTRLENFRLAVRGSDGFRWESFEEAATFCLNNNTNLEEGLKWSDNAVRFQKNFSTLSTNSSLLDKMGNKQKADSVMKEAIATGGIFDLHFYAKKLISQKQNKEALEVFQLNAKRHPKQFTTYAGLARGYSANGDYKTALVNAKLALPLAPNELNKTTVQTFIQKLEKGTDIN
jgi:hypothetical protein